MNKRRLIFSCIIFFSFFSPFLAAQPFLNQPGQHWGRPPGRPPHAHHPETRFEVVAGRGLEIRTNPMGVSVFVDGIFRGVTPLVLDWLPPGGYNIRLSMINYHDHFFHVTTFHNSRVIASVRMRRQLTFDETTGSGLAIRTNPMGVSVFIDGIFRGVTPLVLDRMPSGHYSIRLTKDGFAEHFFSTTVPPNSRRNIFVTMIEESGEVWVTVQREAESRHLADGLNLPFNPAIVSHLSTRIESDPEGISALLSLPVGFNTVTVRAFGWQDRSLRVRVLNNQTTYENIYMRPAVFRIQNGSQNRRRFNPENSGSFGINEYRFVVSAPGTGYFTVLDTDGIAVYERELDIFDTWNQSVVWNGRNFYGEVLPEGVYTIIIEVSPLCELLHSSAGITALRFETRIDSSINIFPVSLSGGISGLTFAPLPYVLPRGSFQIEGSLLFGDFWEERVLSGIPSEFGFRVSPFNSMEIAAAFNVNAHFAHDVDWGVAGSLKYNIVDGTGAPVALAVGVSFNLADTERQSPLNPGSGMGVFVPLSLKSGRVSFVFSPEVFWHVPFGNSSPELFLSAGLFYLGNWMNAGLSVRPKINFEGDNAHTTFLSAAEVRFFPSPSNFFFSFQAGLWSGFRTEERSGRGGFGGLAIGIIY